MVSSRRRSAASGASLLSGMVARVGVPSTEATAPASGGGAANCTGGPEGGPYGVRAAMGDLELPRRRVRRDRASGRRRERPGRLAVAALGRALAVRDRLLAGLLPRLGSLLTVPALPDGRGWRNHRDDPLDDLGRRDVVGDGV